MTTKLPSKIWQIPRKGRQMGGSQLLQLVAGPSQSPQNPDESSTWHSCATCTSLCISCSQML